MARTLMATIAACLVATATPAAASTLVLYDTPASTGQRLVDSPYFAQEFERMVRNGLARPIPVPVNDDGTTRTQDVPVIRPGPIPPLGLGISILQGAIDWRVTTTLANGTLSYDIEIVRRSGYSNGVTVTNQNTTRSRVTGTARADRRDPVFAQRYAAPGGDRMLIGILRR